MPSETSRNATFLCARIDLIQPWTLVEVAAVCDKFVDELESSCRKVGGRLVDRGIVTLMVTGGAVNCCTLAHKQLKVLETSVQVVENQATISSWCRSTEARLPNTFLRASWHQRSSSRKT